MGQRLGPPSQGARTNLSRQLASPPGCSAHPVTGRQYCDRNIRGSVSHRNDGVINLERDANTGELP